MSDDTPRRYGRSLPVLLAALLGLPLVGAAPSQGAGGSADGSEPALGRVLQRALERCAEPALLPALPVRKGSSAARTVAAVARGAGAPARAQALAVTAVLADDLEPGEARRFYRGLTRTAGWESLPPTLALHRVLGTPDPFAYEELWPRATAVLADLAGLGTAQVEAAVEPGAGAPRVCTATPLSRRAVPLPPGSSYALEQGTGNTAVGTGDGVQLAAPCGTPVLAAAAGQVAVTRDDPEGGPWVLTVSGRSGTTRYTHVQAPVVANGDVVTVGEPLAQVGDLGDVEGCALGLASATPAGAARGTSQVVRWLLSGASRGTGLQRLAEQVETQSSAGVLRAQRRGGGTGSAGAASTTTPPQPTAPVTFRVGTLNVLGSHLTGPGSERPRFAPGPVRMARGLARIEASGASVMVFNEFEDPAAAVVSADGDWQLHRATPNNRLRDGSTNGNAVAWRSDTWTEVAASEFTVPWKITLHLPVVTLEHRATGARVTVVGVHNPATTAKAGNQAGARGTARQVELAEVTALRQADPSTPVVVAGDFNERGEVYCAFLGAGLQSSAPRPPGAGCRAPGHSVDWVFGTTGLSFGGEVVDRSTLGSISDHPLLTAAVSLPPQLR